MMRQSVKIIKGRIERLLQSDNIQRILLFPQGQFDVLRYIRPLHNALERGLQFLLVYSFFLLPRLKLVDALHIRVEKIHQRVKDVIDCGEGGKGGIALETGVSGGFADNIALFLLDIGIAVFAAPAAPGEGGAVLFTAVLQMPVNELSAVAAVYASERDGKSRPNVFKSLRCPLAGLVFQRAELRPSEGCPGSGQGERVFARRIAAVMENRVYFAESRLFIVPAPECPDRDLLLQQGSMRCGAGSVGRARLPFPA
jgi:hypothetical protein